MRPSILITNDDGIQAAGLRHLWDAVHDFADVTIVAPHTEKSGSSLAITPTKPLTIREFPWGAPTAAYSINGTPADCVKMAINVILKKPPDLILSGVNRGSNAGRTVLYSGTVGGVMEGALRQIPGIAFSFFDFGFPPIGTVRKAISGLVKHFIAHSMPDGSFINVNFPSGCEKGFKGIRMARQGRAYWLEKPDRRVHPDGTTYYWLGGLWPKLDEEPNSDVALLHEGYATATPIQVGDLTNDQLLQKHQDDIQTITF